MKRTQQKAGCITRENFRSRHDRPAAIIERRISNVDGKHSKHTINSSAEAYNLAGLPGVVAPAKAMCAVEAHAYTRSALSAPIIPRCSEIVN